MKAKLSTHEAIESYLNDFLQISHFKDYCPNGLQVQGKQNIKTVVTGVTASLALIQEAIQVGADAILVHHGWFWKNDDPRIVGQLYTRLQLLMQHEINLFAYHLPLDQHPIIGNNAQLAQILGFKVDGQSTENDLVWFGKPSKNGKKILLKDLVKKVHSQLNRAPLVIGDEGREIKRIAWCTGGAQNYIQIAANLGADAYISGEISEQTTHASRELNIAYLSAGHHATESYGVQALGQHLAKEMGIRHIHIDVPNPV